ncbi:MAG: hypothetical protein JOZ67_10010 [Gammaproteobacteria bacterium]|nr:hypothetical protein [Gammaproteobacteria bacterium]MBV9695925.1 hypothetical protein [Gammaproteobacteria bacterium]
MPAPARALLVCWLALPAAAVPSAPAALGLSPERLARLDHFMQAEMRAGRKAGMVPAALAPWPHRLAEGLRGQGLRQRRSDVHRHPVKRTRTIGLRFAFRSEGTSP